MIRLGLCCKFLKEPIRFPTTTATALSRVSVGAARRKISALCLENAAALRKAIEFCAANGIGAFRVNSHILPLKTHPDVGYDVAELPEGRRIRQGFGDCRDVAKACGVRLLFHPDQFVVLNSPSDEIVRRSVEELVYQAEAANWIGADVVNVHGGGGYGDKAAALHRLIKTVKRLPVAVRRVLTLENDERVFTPADLLPVCRGTGLPLVYDVHHHRCLPDGMSVEAATRAVVATWNREPVFHVSSPREGWQGKHASYHHDYIKQRDFPRCWERLDVTVEVEAKAKECAILRLMKALQRRGVRVGRGFRQN